ncbi:MAG: TlpA family protein disulfide reductase [Phaeodactylibacter sp.]|nr:TlpA family protein disulfide reductase [Phaeodactylibacter sp.]MCB9292890.1 TlpA family protein disulfide reductase [Lewinellaceae bacterium]
MAAGEGQDKVTAQLKALDEEKLALLEAMEKKDPLLGKVAAINTLLSYQNNGAGYENEIDYFANEYFHFVDFKDPAFQYLPWTFEGFRSYTTTIISVGLPEDQQRAYLDGALAKLEKGGLTHKLALSGVIATLKQKNNGLFVYYAGQFVESFKDSDPSAAAGMQAQIEQMKSFVVGGQAPDFTQKTPDGGEMSLSDLRGKVVLLDFWASWCGPCRRENPNVVRMYKKYKEKGFDVLGVSLDKTHDRWIQAIEQDGLEWHHVSDLKGWSNEAAQAYGVRSIPHTVLLDAEGRILARNLRGEALERRLEEIFE